MGKKKGKKKPSQSSAQNEKKQDASTSSSSSGSVPSPFAKTPKASVMSAYEREKKFNIIYEALDNNNLKLASKHLAALLNKYPQDHMTNVLQALVFYRSGDTVQCEKLIAQVAQQHPVDEQVLSTMTLVYKQMHKPSEVVPLYENAVRKAPDVINLAIALYFALGRSQNFVRQQQIAMHLYKKTMNKKYLYWSAISQMATNIDGNDEKDTLLGLAEMMIQRSIDKDKPMPPQEFVVYIQSQVRQGKYEQALECLESPLGQEWKDRDEKIRLRHKLLQELRRYEDIIAMFRAALMEDVNSDNWYYITSYIDAEVSHFRVQYPNDPLTYEAVTRARELFESIQKKERLRYGTLESSEQSRSVGLQRGPFLALVYLYAQLDTNARQPYLLDELSHYTERFSDKHCFFDDVKEYLWLLDANDAAVYLSGMNKQLSEEEDGKLRLPETSSSIRRKYWRNATSYAQVRMYLDGALTSEQAKERALNCIKMYAHVCPEGIHLKCSERGDGDILLVIASQYFLQAFAASDNDNQLLYNAMYVLSYASETNQKENFLASLLMIRLFNHPHIGASKCAYQKIKQLSVKQILLENISHMASHDVIRYGLYGSGTTFLSSVVDLHNQNTSEGPEMVTFAYRENNYEKALDFISFNSRMCRSQVRCLAQEELNRSLLVLLPKSLDVVREYLDNLDSDAVKKARKKKKKKAASAPAAATEQANDLVEKQDPVYGEVAINALDWQVLDSHMDTLIENEDHTVLSSWSSDLSIGEILNRPAFSFRSSSFFEEDRPSKPSKDLGGKPIPSTVSQKQAIGFHRVCMSLFRASVECDVESIRQLLPVWDHLLVALDICSVGALSKTFVFSSFSECLWRGNRVLLECSASLRDCMNISQSFLDQAQGNEEAKDQGSVAAFEDIQIEWSQWCNLLTSLATYTQHMLDLITSAVDEVCQGTIVSDATTDDQKSDDVTTGTVKMKSIEKEAETLVHLSQFTLSFGTWISVLLQVWMEELPSKKQIRKLKKGGSEQEMQMIELYTSAKTTVLTTRDDIKKRFESVKSTITTRVRQLEKLEKVTLDCDHRPSLGMSEVELAGLLTTEEQEQQAIIDKCHAIPLHILRSHQESLDEFAVALKKSLVALEHISM